MPFVETGGARLYYRDFTNPEARRTLLFLHGGWGYEIYPFDRAAKILGGSYRILIPDRSGYGRSPQIESLPENFHSLAAEETLRFLDALGIGQAALWGHSDGAVIAALLGLKASERFPALILEAFHYTRTKRASLDFFRAMQADPESVGSRAQAALARDHGAQWPEVLRRNAAAWLKLVASDSSDLYGGRLGELAPPALFLDGSSDPRIEPGDPEAIRRLLPRAEFQVLEGAGHSPHSEPASAEACARIAAEFLDRALRNEGSKVIPGRSSGIGPAQ